jgi:hypothetical protein
MSVNLPAPCSASLSACSAAANDTPSEDRRTAADHARRWSAHPRQALITADVIVPTYRRPSELARCLRALRLQRVAPATIIVVVRSGDAATLETLREHADVVTVATVDRPGQVAALNRGLEVATADVVAMTDDDAAPRPDWLARIVDHFEANPTLGGVGGRDVVWKDGQMIGVPTELVGRIQWSGRLVGNHHVGAGPPQDVHFLKGVNMAYRRAAIANARFDERLLGGGAQVHNDLAFSLAVRRRGWRLLYDPGVTVDHWPGVRHDLDQRDVLTPTAVTDLVTNETLVVLENLPGVRRAVFVARSVVVGQRNAPGVALFALARATGRAAPPLAAVLKARLEGWRAFRRARRGRG